MSISVNVAITYCKVNSFPHILFDSTVWQNYETNQEYQTSFPEGGSPNEIHAVVAESE
jgi:hypothetical protein